MKKVFLILIVFSVTFLVVGQTPPYIKLGSEQFANTDIYDVLYHDSSDVLYASTNNGFYAYKQNHFIEYKTPNTKIGNSFFDIRLDQKGNVYCSNLAGQIFKVNGNKLELFYQLHKDLVGQKISYFFNSKNNMIIVGVLAAHLVSEEGELIKLLNSETSKKLNFPTTGCVQTKNFDVHCFRITHDAKEIQTRVFKNNGDIITHSKPLTNGSFGSHGFQLFTMENLVFWRDYDGAIYNYSTGKLNANGSHRERIKRMSDSLSLGLGESAGAFVYKLKDGNIKKVRTLFLDRFLSCSYMNKSGTLFLGTFGEGVYIIPKFNSTIQEFPDELLLDLKSTPDNQVFISSRSGNFYKWFGDSLQLYKKSKTNKDYVFLRGNEIFPDIKESDREKGYWSNIINLKDQLFIDDSIFFCVNGSGGMVFNVKLNGKLPASLANRNSSITTGRGRYKAIEFDHQDSSIYLSSESTVYRRSWGDFDYDTLKFNNQIFNTNDLFWLNGLLYCATSNFGVLIYDKGELLDQLDMTSGLLGNDVLEIKIQHDLLFILTTQGLQVYSLYDQKFLGLGFREGVIENNISRFDLSKDKLWLLSKHNFYSIDLKDLFVKKDIQRLYIDSIIANDIAISIDELHSFSHDENNFKFYFDYRDIETKGEAKISYTLLGFYDGWKFLPSSENELEFQSLPPGDYIFQIRSIYRDQKGPVHEFYFEILPPYWQRWWFYLAIVFSVAITIIFYYKNRLKRQEKIALIENEMNASKLTAIQSQMNPHFIFNALNSIQALVLKGDIDNSYTYINKFSSLVRMTLNYSDKKFIELDKEIELIEIYLSLEKLRFREDFQYKIVSTLEEDVLVPPMLIQPFLENSLVHGLIHKAGLKEVTLTFSFDEVLTCTIEDNGIGRVASKKIQERQNPEHKSFAVDAIKNRLDILSERFENRIGFKYEDLMNDGQAVGTRVIIHIPTEQNDDYEE